MLPWPSLISLITYPLVCRPSSQRSRPVLLCLPARSSQTFCRPSISMPILASSPIVLTVPVNLSTVLSAAAVATTWLAPLVLTISAGISAHALPAMVPHFSLPVFSDALTTAMASFAPVLLSVSFSAPIAHAPVPVSSVPIVVHQAFLEHASANHQFSTIEPVASSTSFGAQWSSFGANVAMAVTRSLPNLVKSLFLAGIAPWNWNNFCQPQPRGKRFFDLISLLCKLTSPLRVLAFQSRVCLQIRQPQRWMRCALTTSSRSPECLNCHLQ